MTEGKSPPCIKCGSTFPPYIMGVVRCQICDYPVEPEDKPHWFFRLFIDEAGPRVWTMFPLLIILIVLIELWI